MSKDRMLGERSQHKKNLLRHTCIGYVGCKYDGTEPNHSTSIKEEQSLQRNVRTRRNLTENLRRKEHYTEKN